MGFIDSLFGKRSDDPLQSVDPKLREFLEKESPVKIERPQPPAPSRPTAAATATATATAAADSASPDAQDKPKVPKESLFQDGRYAHLWKTHRPLEEIENATKSDNQKVMDVINAYKDRRRIIGEAALENCALEQIEWRRCMTDGTLADRFVMCKYQVRRFERCYTMQARFLKALGYASVPGRPPHLEEDIQMHADSLFQKMMLHEKEVEKAKEEGRPAPSFKHDLQVKPREGQRQPGPEVLKDWEEKLKELPEADRVAEEAALHADYQLAVKVFGEMDRVKAQNKADKEKRKEVGTQTLSDQISGWFGKG